MKFERREDEDEKIKRRLGERRDEERSGRQEDKEIKTDVREDRLNKEGTERERER